MGFLIFWFLCGVATAIVAGVKGRNLAGWFAVGALTGLFGLVVVACLPRVEDAPVLQRSRPGPRQEAEPRQPVDGMPGWSVVPRHRGNTIAAYPYRRRGG